jgi:putative hydrolase of the HAD superfamily
MVTGNRADKIRSIIDHHQWDNLFDGIAVSAEIGSGKKEDIFLSIFRLLAVNPEDCVFIDNNKENLIIPQGLGVTAIFFDHGKNDVTGLREALLPLTPPAA